MVRLEERLCELEGDARPAEIAFTVGTIRPPGIDHGIGLGELLWRMMMIAYDDIDAEGFCVCHFFDIGAAAVRGDDERAAPGFDLIKRFPAYTARIARAVRNVVSKRVSGK